MKKRIVVSLSALALAASAGAIQPDEVVKRGAEIGDSPLVNVQEVLEDAERFADRTVIVEGEVQEVCQAKGCWMALVPDSAASRIRVTFKDYGFFVPKDATGRSARLEGTFRTTVLSKDEADHLEAEGAPLKRNPDGTATELGFVASGVELRKKN